MSIRRALVAAAATAAVTAGLALTGAPANAAGTRPGFQVPFICGQTWVGAMYSGHNPRMAIDFNHYDANDAPDDRGRRVVASAGGTVEIDYDAAPGYGHYITIRHGNGWTSRYAHLLAGSITVNEGQRVTKGQVIGRVGRSGLGRHDGDHLHYEQRADGTSVLPVFYGNRPASDQTKREYKSPAC